MAAGVLLVHAALPFWATLLASARAQVAPHPWHTCAPPRLQTCALASLHCCTPAPLHPCSPLPLCLSAPLPRTCHAPATQAVLRGVRAAAAGLLIATVLLLLEAVRSPPERAIVLLVLAALNISPARLPSRLGERFVPPLAVLAGAVLGVPLCLQLVVEPK